MLNVLIFLVLIVLFFYILVKEKSILGALIVVLLLGAIAGHFLDFNWREAKDTIVSGVEQIESGEADEKLAELERAANEKLAELEERLEGGTPNEADMDGNEKGFSIRIEINSESAEDAAREAGRVEVKNREILEQYDLEPYHITDYLRETTYAKLYRDTTQVPAPLILVTHNKGEIVDPDIFLMHSDGRLFVGKTGYRNIWPVGAD